jgi:hypothetical protein
MKTLGSCAQFSRKLQVACEDWLRISALRLGCRYKVHSLLFQIGSVVDNGLDMLLLPNSRMKYCEAWIRTGVVKRADVACDIAGSKKGIRGGDLDHTYVRNMNDRSRMMIVGE